VTSYQMKEVTCYSYFATKLLQQLFINYIEIYLNLQCCHKI